MKKYQQQRAEQRARKNAAIKARKERAANRATEGTITVDDGTSAVAEKSKPSKFAGGDHYNQKLAIAALTTAAVIPIITKAGQVNSIATMVR